MDDYISSKVVIIGRYCIERFQYRINGVKYGTYFVNIILDNQDPQEDLEFLDNITNKISFSILSIGQYDGSVNLMNDREVFYIK